MMGEASGFFGLAQAGESYFGGKRRNMSNAKRKEPAGTGRGTARKAAAAGVKDRRSNKVAARVMETANAGSLQGFVREHVQPGSTLYTDEVKACKGMPEFDHETVNRPVAEYVREQAYTNGMESFRSMLKRGYARTFHKLLHKHFQRYVDEFATRHNLRNADTADMAAALAADMAGKRLLYSDLIAGNRLDSGTRG